MALLRVMSHHCAERTSSPEDCKVTPSVHVFISIRTYHVSTRPLHHSLELVVVTCTMYLDAQVQHHLSNLDDASVAAVHAYTASIGLFYCHTNAVGSHT